ncbi:MAG TPA: iron ABC transporter permease [Candidatus Limnocylindrales bacterium]|nr:iron ABC transporter permease [Candidatus Limnocylindrales bacterium]
MTASAPVEARAPAARRRRAAIDPALTIALVIAVAFVVVAILLPIASMVGTSLTDDALPVFQRYTFGPQRQILINTVILGVSVALVGTLVGFLFAYVQVRVPLPHLLKRFMHVMALLPIVSPPFALALSAIVLFGRSGIITRDLLGLDFNIYGLPGMVLVMSLSFFPVAYISLSGLMRALDPALDEAATNLGGSRWHTFRRVTLPLLLPGLASGFLLLFVEALADLGNPIVLGGNFQVLASRMYLAIIGQYDLLGGAVLGLLLLVPSLIVYFVHRYYAERASVVSVTGKPSGRPAELTHRPVAILLTLLAIGVSLLVLLMYGTIAWGAFTNLVGVDNTLTTKNFEFVLFGYGLEAVSDTVLLAAIATPLAGVLGVVIAFLVIRGRFWGRLALDFGTMLGVAVPGTVFGIGYLLAFNTPVELLGIPVIPKLTGGAAVLGGAIAIVMVFVVRSVPGGLRSGAAALQQIDPTIEEASVSLGADQATTFRRVVLPLIRPAFLTGLIYSFARSMTAISAIVFLTTPSTRIMTQQILNETNAARFGNALAYCVILIVIVCAAIALLYWIIGSSTRVDRGVAQPAEATLVRST